MRAFALLAVVVACAGCSRFEHPIVGAQGPELDAALRDGLVAGSTPEDPKAKNFTVTASGAELRAFLEGYGAVIFKDEATAEFHRVAER